MPLPLTAIVAIAENSVIGRDNALPWRLRSDLRRFRALTMGKPLVVGRRNWESIGRPLPGRDIVVLTRRADFAAEGVVVAHSWDDALALAEAVANRSGAREIVIGGGAEIYRLALPRLSRLLLTRVHASPDGDVLFPAYRPAEFCETFREAHPAGPEDEHPFTFIDLERVPEAGTSTGRPPPR